MKNDKKIQIIVDNTPVLFLSLFLLPPIGHLRYYNNSFILSKCFASLREQWGQL